MRYFCILCFISILPLLVFYIFQVNKAVSENYLLERHKRKLNEIIQESKNLEINFFQKNSLGNIETLTKNLEFEKVDKVHYIQVLEGKVVSK